MRSALGLPLLVLLAACGSARPAFDGTTYTSGQIAFRVPPAPPAWRRIDVDGAAIAFRDDAHDASVLVEAHCGERDEDVPLAALTNHLVMGTTQREISLEETIPFDQREALHTRMSAKLDGVPRAFDIYVLKKNGCVYDFVYVAAPAPAAPAGDGDARAPEGAAEFERFVMGFRTVGGAP